MRLMVVILMVVNCYLVVLNSLGQNTGMGSLSLLQGIFPTQESNWGLLHCRQILYQLSYQGSPDKTRFDSWIGKVHWGRERLPTPVFFGFPCASAGEESACNAGDLGSIPGLRRSPGEGNGFPLQYPGLDNSVDCIIRWVTKNRTRLSDFHFFKTKIVTTRDTYLVLYRTTRNKSLLIAN